MCQIPSPSSLLLGGCCECCCVFSWPAEKSPVPPHPVKMGKLKTAAGETMPASWLFESRVKVLVAEPSLRTTNSGDGECTTIDSYYSIDSVCSSACTVDLTGGEPMHGARAARARFRNFSYFFSMHGARVARARGFDSSPSVNPDVGCCDSCSWFSAELSKIKTRKAQ